ncbi:MAG: NADH-quinone oxidoreductase subunit NuoB [Candidatus Aenigmarchaeota archaeon]|nr:NADH-quinone oxidoreductase subunit NuoB [Candidatus Aenigmarchaeota archaeon]
MKAKTLNRSLWVFHVNTGSCLPPESEIILGDGRITGIGEFVDGHLTDPGINDITTQRKHKVLSWNSYSPAFKDILQVHRLKSPEKLVTVKTLAGESLRMTPDHKVLVDGLNGTEWIEAKDLKVGCHIYSPSSIEVDEYIPSIIDLVSDHYVATIPEEIRSSLKKKLTKKFSTLANASRTLGIDMIRIGSKHRSLSIGELKKIAECININWKDISGSVTRISGKNFVYDIKKMEVDSDFMRMMGLVASDGWIMRIKDNGHANYQINFSNTSDELINDFVRCCKSWTDGNFMKEEKNGVKKVYTYSPVLVNIAQSLGLKVTGKDADLRPIFRLPKKLIASFLSGYFDGDGSIHFLREENRKRVGICFTTANARTADQIRLLLKRLGIRTRTYNHIARSSFSDCRLYKINITSQSDIKRFLDIIKFRHPKKVGIIKSAMSIMAKSKKKQSLHERAPLVCGKIIKMMRQKHGIKQSDISGIDYMPMIEGQKRRFQKTTIMNVIKSLKSNGCDNLSEIENLVSDSFYLDSVKEVKIVKSDTKWVYNITVDESHSFIPNGGFVVKNCNGCDIEIVAALTPRYDVERFGMKLVGSPRHADVLLVTGPVTRDMKKKLKLVYDQTPDPKVVMSVGNCGNSTGVFYESYNIEGPIDRIVPVDVYVKGCPPRPEAIIDGVVKAWKKLEELGKK